MRKRFLSLVLVLHIVFTICSTSAGYAFANNTSEEVVISPMISAGCYQSAALKTDGSLWIWGDFSRLYPSNAPLGKQTTPLKIMDDVIFVSLPNNGAHGSLIKSDYSLWKWGYNVFGYLGDGTTKSTHIPVKIMDDVIYTACGGSYSAAIKSDNTLWMWGNNQKGQLGTGENKTVNIPTKIMNDVKKVSLGTQHSAAIKNDNSLWMWGNNEDGQLGDGTTKDKSIPIKILNDVADIYLKNDTTYAIKTDGTLWAWGSNSYGDFGVEDPSSSIVPIKVMENVAQVSSNAVLKTDGSVWTWHGIYHSTWQGTYHSKTELEFFQPTKIMDDVKNISCAGINMAIKNDNSLWCWNTDTERASMWVPIGDGTTTSSQIPVNIMNLTQFANADIDTPVLKAKKLTNNHEYNFYKDSDVPHTIMANAIGDASLMKGYYSLTEDILHGKSTNFYEIILFEILIENFENKELLTNIADTIEENAVTTFVNACSEMYDDTLGDNYYMTAEFLDGAIDEERLIKFTQFSGFPEALDFLNYHFEKGQKAFKTYRELVNAIRYAYMLNAVGDLQIEALEQIALCSSNAELTSAANSFITKIKNAKTNPEIIFAMEFGKFGVEVLVDTLKDEIDKNFISKNPYGLLYKYAYKTGKFVADNVYNASELSYDALCIIAINEIDKAMVTSLDALELDLNNHPTVENAKILIVMADAYKDLILYGDNICISYVEGVKKGQVKKNAFEKFVSAVALNPVLIAKILGGKDADCDSVLSSLNSIDRCVKTSDWYSGFEDYSKYMMVVRSTNYSPWATDSIKGAKVLGFLPEYLECNYTESITRAEFATFLVNFIERKSGKSVHSLLEENELPMISVPFDDALFIDVDYAYRLGLIKGKGEGKFDPLAEITREEAAVMLTRTVKLLGYDTTAFNYNLPGGISSWANDSVNFVYEKGIMQGDGTGFNPKGNITKEQTIATLYRIFYNI
ncbi:MAG: S-layer homology domain-containing protein [Oscillospiraceae bacterium]|nr:S-layer homology domain-containing protein [Oscillospiraceae bacterium]